MDRGQGEGGQPDLNVQTSWKLPVMNMPLSKLPLMNMPLLKLPVLNAPVLTLPVL